MHSLMPNLSRHTLGESAAGLQPNFMLLQTDSRRMLVHLLLRLRHWPIDVVLEPCLQLEESIEFLLPWNVLMRFLHNWIVGIWMFQSSVIHFAHHYQMPRTSTCLTSYAQPLRSVIVQYSFLHVFTHNNCSNARTTNN